MVSAVAGTCKKTQDSEHLTQPGVHMQAGQGSGSTVSRSSEQKQQYHCRGCEEAGGLGMAGL